MVQQSAQEDRRHEFERQVDADGDGEHGRPERRPARFQDLIECDDRDADQGADGDHVPRQFAAEDALRDRGHQGGLRCRQRLRMRFGGDADAVGIGEQVQHRCHDERAARGADGEHDLLTPRRRTDDMTALEVLQVVAGDAGGAADHRADHHRRDRTDRAVRTHHEQQHHRREQDGGDGDARHRVVRGSHEARHVGRHRTEQEPRDDHDDRHRQADGQRADDDLVEREQRQREEDDADQHPFHGQILFGMGDHGAGCAGARRCQPAADAREQGAAQRHERPDAADQHRTDAEVADLFGPYGVRDVLRRETGGRLHQFGVARQHIGDIERDRDVPGDHRAGEHHDADVETDDVADAEQCRREVGAEVGEVLAEEPCACSGVGDQAQAAAGGELRERAAERRNAEDADPLRRVLAGFQHFCGSLTFREREFLLDDQCAT